MADAPRKQSLFGRYWWVGGIIVALAVVLVLAPNASSDPDGLEKVAEDKGFVEEGKDPGYEWLPDYTIPGVESEFWSTVLSGMIGVGIMAAVVGIIAFALVRIRRMRAPDDGTRPVPRAG